MSLRKKATIVAAGLVALIGIGCGPGAAETWMIGVFSDRIHEMYTSSDSVHHYQLEADGAYTEVAVGVSGEIGWERLARWEARGEDRIAIIPEQDDPFWTGSSEYVLQREGPCGPYEISEVRADDSRGWSVQLVKGKMCVRRHECPEPENCNGYDTYWCEPPPACDDE